MKKFIIVILVLAVCAAAIYFGYPEISKLINGEQTAMSSETNSTPDISSAENSSDVQTSNIPAEGGNSGNTEKFALELTISEDKYFIDNHEISLDELKVKIDALEPNSAVAINDENSTLKAYNAVKDYLRKKNIGYTVTPSRS